MRILSVFLFGMLALAQPPAFMNVSTASGAAVLAPDSVASAVAGNFPVQQTVKTPGLPLTMALGGISVQVVDAAGKSQLAGLYFVSPSQINYVIPAGAAPGAATVNILTGTTIAMSAPARLAAVAPALFSANMNGKGVAAATAVAVAVPTNIQSPVPVFSCLDAPGSCNAVPIPPGLDRPVYLSFFGSGIRGAKTVTATIGGMEVPVLYAGPQPTYPGLDQVNLPLTLNLRGAGLVDVVVTADGMPSNAVQINVQ